ncbi:MAG: DUF2202 domain-containing protein [Clostridia bacterium]|nr:DUF2202 domain-containing protein [Clostridia bacterium]
MKKRIYLITTIFLAFVMFSGCATPVETETSPQPTESLIAKIEAEDAGYGAIGSFENPDSELEQMLIYAIQDEYLARAEYEYLINELKADKPFTNIIKAEEKHISMLIPLFEKYGFDVPEDTSSEHLISVTSITEALETGVQAEIDNIAMYEMFLERELPDDIRSVFIELRDGSKNHLSAFERKLNR